MPEPSALALPDGGVARGPLPLQGLVILAVDDSRFACEALRLLCQHSGARLRRADTLEAAARHLSRYQPDVVIVDLGLPDGDGTDLIRALAARGGDGPLVIATSGDPELGAAGRTAGAADFLAKPPVSLALFQQTILAHLPGPPPRPTITPATPLRPDALALRDDLLHAAALLAAQRRYVAGFLGSLAHSAHDACLARAAEDAAAQEAALPRLAALISERLAKAPCAFS